MASASNAGQEYAIGHAMIDGIERAQAAAAAKEPHWEHAQLVAAEKERLHGLSFKRDLAPCEAGERFQRSHVPNLRITPPVIRRLQRSLPGMGCRRP